MRNKTLNKNSPFYSFLNNISCSKINIFYSKDYFIFRDHWLMIRYNLHYCYIKIIKELYEEKLDVGTG